MVLSFNLASEYSALVIVVAILISFTRDYNSDHLSSRFLKITYYTIFATIASTIFSIQLSTPGIGSFYNFLSYLSNLIYFILIPSPTLCYCIYSKIITSLKFDERNYKKRLFPLFLPYIIYIGFLILNIFNQKIFYISEEYGYVRGEWSQLPYIVVGLNILTILYVILKNRQLLHKDTIKIMFYTVLLAFLTVTIQYLIPDTIMTGLLSTISILSLHLYTQNANKSKDLLTGLHNRLALMHKITEYVDLKTEFTVYVFSLRGFKMFNERYGLIFGDKVLVNVATFFMNCVPYSNIFRYNGDEFALLIKKDEPNHQKWLNDIVAYFDKYITIDGFDISIDMIYARVDYPEFGENVNELITTIDYAISVLKESNNSELRYLYEISVVKDMLEKNEMLYQIKRAILEDTFEIHYQPMYCAKTNRFTQAEALVRIRDSNDLLLYPYKFIDIAEKTGLIIPMTYMILDSICQDLRKILDTQKGTMILDSISINFPYLQFEAPHMQETVIEILAKYEIPAHMIKIEITERTIISDAKKVENAMYEMREQGFVFELDDFGVDYSNMHTFLDLSLNIIKLDRSLLLSALRNVKNRNFFEHLVTAIKSTERTTIIEGVEEREQLDFVLKCGCDYIQGFFFSRPLPFEDFSVFIEESQQIKTLSERDLIKN